MLEERLTIYSLPLEGECGKERRIVEDRGELAQIEARQGFLHLAYWSLQPAPGAFRGRHYHLQKEEFMYVLQGTLEAFFEDLDTQERKDLTLSAGTKAIILPRLAHKFIAREFVQVVEFSPQIFDPGDAYPYSV